MHCDNATNSGVIDTRAKLNWKYSCSLILDICASDMTFIVASEQCCPKAGLYNAENRFRCHTVSYPADCVRAMTPADKLESSWAAQRGGQDQCLKPCLIWEIHEHLSAN